MIVIASLGLSTYTYYTKGYGFRPRWREAFGYVAAHRAPEEGILALHPALGKYYLQDDSVTFMPTTPEGLSSINGSAWLVSVNDADVAGRRYALAGLTSLEAVFAPKVPAPYSEVVVYRYVPSENDSAVCHDVLFSPFARSKIIASVWPDTVGVPPQPLAFDDSRRN